MSGVDTGETADGVSGVSNCGIIPVWDGDGEEDESIILRLSSFEHRLWVGS